LLAPAGGFGAGQQLCPPNLHELLNRGPGRVRALVVEQLADLVGGQRAHSLRDRRQRQVVVVAQRQVVVFW